MEDFRIGVILHLLVGPVLCIPGLAEPVCTQTKALHHRMISYFSVGLTWYSGLEHSPGRQHLPGNLD